MADVTTGPAGRSTYRHGDLRRALLEAGIALARAGGPDAVVLREATRRAGVVPNAAYRHFAGRDALLQAVRAAALSALAVAIETELELERCHDAGKRASIVAPAKAGVQASGDDGADRLDSRLRGNDGSTPADAARARLRAVGRAYLRFAREETGLFRTAFAVPGTAPEAVRPEMVGESGLNPFQLLGSALDAMVAAGALPAARRPGAEYLAWSAVHGLAMLVIEGPLHAHPRTQIAAIEDRLLAMVEDGL